MPSLRRLGTSKSVRTCDHCGKKGLAKTIVFAAAGNRRVYMGSGCAKSIGGTARRARKAPRRTLNQAIVADDLRVVKTDGFTNGSDNSDQDYNTAREAARSIPLHKLGAFFDKTAENAANEYRNWIENAKREEDDTVEFLRYEDGKERPAADRKILTDEYIHAWKRGFRGRLKDIEEEREEERGSEE